MIWTSSWRHYESFGAQHPPTDQKLHVSEKLATYWESILRKRIVPQSYVIATFISLRCADYPEKLLNMVTPEHDLLQYSLTERDLRVLQIIEEEDLASFSFGGIRRRLSMHPESLSRVLTKLEDMDILEKGFEGYVVKPKAKGFFGFHPLKARESSVHLLQTLLPVDVSREEIVAELKGTWFGILRWFGCVENEDEITLKWITDDGEVQVDARLGGQELNVEAEILSGNEQRKALEASYQLISHLSKMYSRTARSKRTNEHASPEAHFQLA
jgi:hypothetical protein